MDSFQLKRVLEADALTKSSFRGVYASDQLRALPKPLHLPASYVINEDIASEKGSHWVVLYINEHRKAEYFDSYGEPPIKPIQRFIRRLTWSPSTRNNVQLQNFNTQTCGPFCLLYLVRKAQGYSLENMIQTYFTTNTSKLLQNDYLVRNFVCQCYQVHLTIPIG